uniref:LEM domain-containing protein n=1 Tax=Moschus moschiferus TaxID=68415 RepID=A0A8C6CSN3_MOSMO
MVEVKCLNDDELQNELDKLGFSPGPILPSTRKVYEKKLVQLLVSTPCAPPKKNGPGELDRAQDNDDSEDVLQEHQTSDTKHRGTSKRKPAAVNRRAGNKKRFQWA